jgi:hypothetical protein
MWCLIMPSRNSRSNSTPFAAARRAISSCVSMPGHQRRAVHVMRVRVRQFLPARAQPALHHVNLVFLRDRDAQRQPAHGLVLRAVVDEGAHLERLRVVADHALHELDVGLGELHARLVGGLSRRDGPRFLPGAPGCTSGGGGSGAGGCGAWLAPVTASADTTNNAVNADTSRCHSLQRLPQARGARRQVLGQRAHAHLVTAARRGGDRSISVASVSTSFSTAAAFASRPVRS